AAVGGGVLDEHVLVALLEAEDSCRVLPAVVHALDMAADAEVEGVPRDHVSAAAPQGDPPPREERTVIVVHAGIRDPIEDDSVLGAPDPDAADGHVARVLDAHGAAVLVAPFAGVIVMRKHPVRAVLAFAGGPQALAEVVREIAAVDDEAVGAGGEHGVSVSMDARALEPHIASVLDADPDPVEVAPWRLRGSAVEGAREA